MTFRFDELFYCFSNIVQFKNMKNKQKTKKKEDFGQQKCKKAKKKKKQIRFIRAT